MIDLNFVETSTSSVENYMINFISEPPNQTKIAVQEDLKTTEPNQREKCGGLHPWFIMVIKVYQCFQFIIISNTGSIVFHITEEKGIRNSVLFDLSVTSNLKLKN